MESEGVNKKIILAAKNHLDRAHEGQRLLAEGKPLSEMKIEAIGLEQDEFRKTREESLKRLQSMTGEELIREYGGVLALLNIRLKSPDKGTSELEWKRLMIEMIYEERGQELPTIDLDKFNKKT